MLLRFGTTCSVNIATKSVTRVQQKYDKKHDKKERDKEREMMLLHHNYLEISTERRMV